MLRCASDNALRFSILSVIETKYLKNKTATFPYFQNQNSLSEIEKREKRAMERKLSEMEEELKVNNVLFA